MEVLLGLFGVSYKAPLSGDGKVQLGAGQGGTGLDPAGRILVGGCRCFG